MTKREALYEEARRLYVVFEMTLRAIAARLGVSERTLQLWANDNRDGKGTWNEQKAGLVDGNEAFHAELISIATVLTRQAKEELLAGQLDCKLISSLDRIVKAALKVLEYEKKSPPKQAPKTPEEKRQAISGKIRETLGLR